MSKAYIDAESMLVEAWDALQAVPSYVERHMFDAVMPQDEYEAILEQISPIPVPMDDAPIHTTDRPFCSDESCPCHMDDSLFDEYIYQPMMDGLMTSFEANRFRFGETL